jgi:hypothetical protein
MLRLKVSLAFYGVIKADWGREDYMSYCNRYERSLGSTRFTVVVWKLRGLRCEKNWTAQHTFMRGIPFTLF